jgi:hypothetical protein
MVQYVPLDGEPRHSRLLCKDVSADSFNDRFGGWLIVHLLIIVLIVDVIANAHKLSAIVRACQKNDRDT